MVLNLLIVLKRPLSVLNDILLATDSGDSVVLVLLDLSAVFDTVDHSILIYRLQSDVGLKDTVLKCFISSQQWRPPRLDTGTLSFFPVYASSGFHSKKARDVFSFLRWKYPNLFTY